MTTPTTKPAINFAAFKKKATGTPKDPRRFRPVATIPNEVDKPISFREADPDTFALMVGLCIALNKNAMDPKGSASWVDLPMRDKVFGATTFMGLSAYGNGPTIKVRRTKLIEMLMGEAPLIEEVPQEDLAKLELALAVKVNESLPEEYRKDLPEQVVKAGHEVLTFGQGPMRVGDTLCGPDHDHAMRVGMSRLVEYPWGGGPDEGPKSA